MIDSTQGVGKGAGESWPPVHIRNLNPDVWRGMKIGALEEGLTMAQLVEQLWEFWSLRSKENG